MHSCFRAPCGGLLLNYHHAGAAAVPLAAAANCSVMAWRQGGSEKPIGFEKGIGIVEIFMAVFEMWEMIGLVLQPLKV